MAKKPRPFRIHDVKSLRELSQLAASPDGSHAAMTVNEVSADGNRMTSRIWLLDESAGEGARPITAEGKRASLPKFSGDGRHLAYLSECEEDRMQLTLLSAPFGEPRVLTKFEHGVKSFDWLDGRRLLVVAPPDTVPARKKAKDRKDDAYEVDADEPRSRMWLVTVTGGRPKRVGPAHGHVCVAAASPDGRHVSFAITEHSTLDVLWRGSELHLLDVRSGRSGLLRRMSSPSSGMLPPVFSPDGSRIAFVDSPKRGMIYPHRLFVTDLEGGKVVRIDARADRVQVELKWLDERTVLYLQQDGTTWKLRRAPAAGGTGRDLLDLPGVVMAYAVAGRTGRVFFTCTRTDRPTEVFTVRASDGGTPEQLTGLNRKLGRLKHSVGEIVQWKSKQGWTVEGLFFRPTRNVRPPYATVVIPHGGPHGAAARMYDWRTQAFCSHGYAVFLPNFRGSTGYGTRFMLCILKNWTSPADDIIRGIRSLARKKLIDRR